MATPQNRRNTRISRPPTGRDELLAANQRGGDTSKKSYTSLRYGNDHGSISFGHLHKQADVTSDILLQASDGRHSFSLDKDGPRKGWTTSISPGNFQVQCGSENEEDRDTLFLNAINGNIVIKADNGKIRLEGDDVEIIARGSDGNQGNIQIKASENIVLEGKKIYATAKSLIKMVSSGKLEMSASSSMKIYSSLIRGVTDAVSAKDSKVGGRNFQVSQIEF